MKSKTVMFSIVSVILILMACSKNETGTEDKEPPVVMKATGDINPVLNQFRQLLGVKLNTSPGATGGRREINWDGVPESLLNKDLPNDFFNPTGLDAEAANQRGLVYSSVGNFRVSRENFAEVNAVAADQFESFSGDRTFANISSNLWDVEFEVPGQAIDASVQGFGIVFSDVDKANSTSLEFFSADKSLGKYFVPAKDGSNFSFLGVWFPNEKITRVQISHEGPLDSGEADISQNGQSDLVVMDNFLYNEPVKQ